MAIERKLTTYQGVKIDDTACWHLVVYVSERGLSAYLKNREDLLEPTVKIVDESWTVDESSLLSQIESAVYDHPQLLDDFSTDIIISTPYVLWMPKKVVDDLYDMEELTELYNTIYCSEEDDIFQQQVGDGVVLFSLIDRLGSFLRRTLSGANICSELGVLTEKFVDRRAEDGAVYANIREREVDIIAYDRRGLLVSAVQTWRDPMDICYHIMNTVDVWNLDPSKVQVSLSGIRDVRIGLLKELRNHVKFAMQTMLPSAVNKEDMPLAVSLKLV